MMLFIQGRTKSTKSTSVSRYSAYTCNHDSRETETGRGNSNMGYIETSRPVWAANWGQTKTQCPSVSKCGLHGYWRNQKDGQWARTILNLSLEIFLILFFSQYLYLWGELRFHHYKKKTISGFFFFLDTVLSTWHLLFHPLYYCQVGSEEMISHH